MKKKRNVNRFEELATNGARMYEDVNGKIEIVL
jgi:hypothetical protein